MPCLFAHKSRPLATHLAFVCLLGLSALAQPAQAQFQLDLFTTQHGLPQNTVNAITQTREGYLWLATYDGLVRYDGARFVVFDRATQPGIRSNRFSALYEDRAGNLWAGTEEGLLTRHRAGQFTTFAPADPLANLEIRRIEEDDDGNLWATTTQSLVCLRDGQSRVYDPHTFWPGLRIVWPNGIIGRVWWGQDAAGLHLFSRGRLLTYPVQKALPGLRVSLVLEDGGALWVGADKGLVKIKDSRMTVFTDRDGLPRRLIGGFEDRQGDVWVNSGRALLRLRDRARLEIEGITAGQFQDREGVLWIGTANGLYRVRQAPISGLEPRGGVGGDEWISTILQDRSGDVWIGGWGGGLSHSHAGVFSHHTSEAQLFSRRITALYEDREGTIWISTEGGVSRFKEGRLSRYSNEQGLDEVFDMRQDRAGNFWFATKTGLTKLRDGVFTRYTTRDGLPHNNVKVILEGASGALWLGTYGGLARLAEGRFTAYTEREGFTGEHIRALYEDGDGALWIGTTDAGLHRFKDGRFTAVTTRDGLFNNGVFRILEDRHGYFWMSCNLGIYRVRRQELNDFAEGRLRSITSIPYGVKDGMPTAECNGGRQPAGWQMHDGRLWFPTQNGVAVIDPEAITINRTPPPIVIETVRANREPLPFGEEARVPPGRSHLEIEFTGLSFLKPEHVRFRYRLTGLETDWVEAGNRRTAYYSPLAPGDYTFTVLAANSDGVWNTEGRSLRIVVEPSWWQTWWFKVLATLSGLGLALGAWRRRLVRLKREHETQQATLEHERATQEAFARQLIEAQESERNRLARELHDGLKNELTLINYAAQRGLLPRAAEAEHVALMRTELEEVALKSHNASAAVSEIVRDLRPQILEAGLTEALRSIVNQAQQISDTSFTVELAPLDGLLPPDLEIHLYRLVQEGVANILHHAQAGNAQVTVSRAGADLQIVIRDNGRGFDPTTRSTDGRANHGFGLVNLAQRVQILHGVYEIHSAPGAGTTITIQLNLPGLC